MSSIGPERINSYDPKELERYRQDALFVRDNYPDLLAQYPQMFVAVLNRQVIGHHVSLETLITDLTDRKIDPGWVYMRRMITPEQAKVANRLARSIAGHHIL